MNVYWINMKQLLPATRCLSKVDLTSTQDVDTCCYKLQVCTLVWFSGARKHQRRAKLIPITGSEFDWQPIGCFDVRFQAFPRLKDHRDNWPFNFQKVIIAPENVIVTRSLINFMTEIENYLFAGNICRLFTSICWSSDGIDCRTSEEKCT